MYILLHEHSATISDAWDSVVSAVRLSRDNILVHEISCEVFSMQLILVFYQTETTLVSSKATNVQKKISNASQEWL